MGIRKVLLGLLAAGILGIGAVCFLRHPANHPLSSVPPADLPAGIRTGDVIRFGTYEQDNDPSNGPEAVEWQVLAVEDGRALLISRYALDAQPFNEKWAWGTWESSSMRKWLNGEFYTRAFSPGEQKRILSVTNINSDNPLTGIRGGKDTVDRVFLLSISEAAGYFDSDEARRCRATAFAKANGAYLNEYQGSSWWWLRSRGSNSRTGALVLFSGYVDMVGFGVNNAGGYIRPSIWIGIPGTV